MISDDRKLYWPQPDAPAPRCRDLRLVDETPGRNIANATRWHAQGSDVNFASTPCTRQPGRIARHESRYRRTGPPTDRTQSLSPLFSWMTTTPPRAFGRLRTRPGAHLGPAQVIGMVGSAPSPFRRRLRWRSRPAGRHRRGSRWASCPRCRGDQRRGRRGAHPSSASLRRASSRGKNRRRDSGNFSAIL